MAINNYKHNLNEPLQLNDVILNSGNVNFVSSGGTDTRGIIGLGGNNDYWFFGGGATSSDAGFAQISTGDNGTEPIYVRQYLGDPRNGTLQRTVVLLNESGNTSFPNNVGVGTTNPTSTFHVVGNSNFVGVITATSLIPAETRFISVAEKLTRVNGNTVSLVYNASGTNIGLATNPSGDITLAVTGIPTTSDFDNHVLTFSIFVNQTGTARSCTAVTLNGVSRTIKWFGGSLASAISGVTTSSGYDIYSFTGINTIGSASTAANYDVLGVVNGGFR